MCRSVLEHRERGVALKEQAVLFRASHHSDLLEVELARRNIPFVKYGGLKFLEAAHVKDALGCSRLLENPWDELAWFRVLQLPEGIGPAGARRLMDELGVRRSPTDGVSVETTPLVNLLDHPFSVPARASEAMRALRWRSPAASTNRRFRLAAQLERVRTYLEPVIARKYDAPAARLADLDQLAVLAQGHVSRGRSWPSSRSIRRRLRATSRVRRSSTRTGSSCRRSIRRRASSGTSCT